MQLLLSNPTGGAAIHHERGHAVLRIVPSDGGPGDDEQEGAGAFKLASRRLAVGEADGAVMVTVERSGGHQGAVSVDYTTANGTALAGDDYEAAAGTLSWDDGDGAAKAFMVDVLDDDAVEGGELFHVLLSHPTGGAKLVFGRSTADVGIVDDESGDCVESDTALCLLGGRFRVDATWRTPGGAVGAARHRRVSANSGLLWFFDEANAEALIKLLDGCDVPGLEAYWVFLSTTTNLELTVTVTDTLTGQAHHYRAAQGRSLPPVIDVTSFKACR